MDKQASHQIVCSVQRFRIYPQAWLGNISRKVIISIEGQYKKRTRIESSQYQLQEQVQIALPWKEGKLDSLLVHYHYIDERLTSELGYSVFPIPTDSSFHTDGRENQVLLDILPNGAENRLGKILFEITVQQLYNDDNHDKNKKFLVKKSEKSHEKALYQQPLPDFKFKRFSKPINWSKITAIDIPKVLENNDQRTVLGCMDDVMQGDAAEQDCDPRLLQATQLAQLASQYLFSSKKMLEQKKLIIQEASDTFQQEEDLLDLHITKLKARKRAQRRELEEMERISASYEHTLKSLGYKKKMNKQKQQEQELEKKGRAMVTRLSRKGGKKESGEGDRLVDLSSEEDDNEDQGSDDDEHEHNDLEGASYDSMKPYDPPNRMLRRPMDKAATKDKEDKQKKQQKSHGKKKQQYDTSDDEEEEEQDQEDSNKKEEQIGSKKKHQEMDEKEKRHQSKKKQPSAHKGNKKETAQESDAEEPLAKRTEPKQQQEEQEQPLSSGGGGWVEAKKIPINATNSNGNNISRRTLIEYDDEQQQQQETKTPSPSSAAVVPMVVAVSGKAAASGFQPENTATMVFSADSLMNNINTDTISPPPIQEEDDDPYDHRHSHPQQHVAMMSNTYPAKAGAVAATTTTPKIVTMAATVSILSPPVAEGKKQKDDVPVQPQIYPQTQLQHHQHHQEKSLDPYDEDYFGGSGGYSRPTHNNNNVSSMLMESFDHPITTANKIDAKQASRRDHKGYYHDDEEESRDDAQDKTSDPIARQQQAQAQPTAIRSQYKDDRYGDVIYQQDHKNDQEDEDEEEYSQSFASSLRHRNNNRRTGWQR